MGGASRKAKGEGLRAQGTTRIGAKVVKNLKIK